MEKLLNCPCNKENIYNNCCKPIHENIFLATTAEKLMRSRYSAFVMEKGDFLHQSHHTTTRPKSKLERKNLIIWANSVSWVKLEILKTAKGNENDNSGTVEFKAYFFDDSSLKFLHEKSSFIKENGHWVYFEKMK